MQSSATEPGSTTLSILLRETQKEGGPSTSPHRAITLVLISSVFRAMHAIRPLCQPDTTNMLLGVKFLKPTNRLLAELEGSFMNEEWGCLFKHSSFQIIWEISILARACTIKCIHSTFYNCQNCQKMAHYLCVHTHIQTSDLFLAKFRLTSTFM